MYIAVAFMLIAVRFHRNSEDSRVQCGGTRGKALRIHRYSADARVHEGHSTLQYSVDSHVHCGGKVP